MRNLNPSVTTVHFQPRFTTYAAMREKGAPAWGALRASKAFAAFNALEEQELARVREVADDNASYDDLAGDMFNPDVNKGLPGGERRLKSEEKEFKRRLRQDGTWGYIAEVRATPTSEWIEVHAIWGFVGDDFIASVYDSDLAQACVDWHHARLDAEHFKGFEDCLEVCLCQ